MGIFGFSKSKKQYRKDGVLELPDDRRISLGQPDKYPFELVKRITDYLEAKKYDCKILLAQIYIENDAYPPHPLVGIQIAEESITNFSAIQKELVSLVKGSGSELVDFMEIVARADLTAPIFKNFRIIYDKTI